MPRYRALVALVGLLGVAFAAGCAPQLELMQADPALSHRALSEGRVAVLPVSADIHEVTLLQLRRLDGILGYAFDVRADELARVPPATVFRAIARDRDTWEAVIGCYNTGKIELSAVRRLSRAVGARYLVFTFLWYSDIRNGATTFSQTTDARSRVEMEGMDPDYAAQRASFANMLRSADTDVPSPEGGYGGGDATSELVGYVALVDADTGAVRWKGKHRVRAGGGSPSAPDPPRLAWRLFSQMIARLPQPE
jgi:hypothetical protein